MLVYVRPSNEVTDDPSELARFFFKDGSWVIFHCARPTRAVLSRALREHRRSSSPFPPLFREHRTNVVSFPSFLVGALRAQKAI